MYEKKMITFIWVCYDSEILRQSADNIPEIILFSFRQNLQATVTGLFVWQDAILPNMDWGNCTITVSIRVKVSREEGWVILYSIR